MLALAGDTPEQAQKQADGVMALETALAKASLSATERRDPENTYHLAPISSVSKQFPMGLFGSV